MLMDVLLIKHDLDRLSYDVENRLKKRKEDSDG